jgi:hypothetical protein
MAIQVNGTEVISNSRALNNIASVDATTVAAMTAAGVGGSNIMFTDAVKTSQTYTFKATGTVFIQAIGAGGSGAMFSQDNAGNGNATCAITGGAAGGYSRKTVAVTAGDTLTITIGAGGARIPQNTSNEKSNGNTGGTTTVTGSNLGSGNTSISLTANGGGGGLYNGAGGSYTNRTVGPTTGGTASGGDVNNTGGTSSASATSSSNSYDDGAEQRYGLARGAFPTILGSPEAVTIDSHDYVNRRIDYNNYEASSTATYSSFNDSIAYAVKQSAGFTDASPAQTGASVLIRRSTTSTRSAYLSDSGSPSNSVGTQQYSGAGGPALIQANSQFGGQYSSGSFGANGVVYITYKDE